MTLNHQYFSTEAFPANRAFLFGDAVKVWFYIHGGKLVMAEECYFFLMASMRKMRMNIPLDYTLDFFETLFAENVLSKGVSEAVITFLAYRENSAANLTKAPVSFYFEVNSGSIFEAKNAVEIDLIKEISVNTNLLSNIRVHCPENTYAEIYAAENDLDDVILLNPSKRIARASSGNLLFLEGDKIKVPKQTEGAYISPLMENFVTFLHKNKLAEIQESELIAFESQKAEEILLISDEKGVFGVGKIRNKTFSNHRFADMVSQWRASF